MNHVYIADISGLYAEKDKFLQNVTMLMSEHRNKKIQKYKTTDDKIRSAVCGLLLNMAWTNSGNNSKYEECADSKGRPYIKNAPDFFFSIAHSKDKCALIWSKKRCGIDIQKTIELKNDISKRFFHPYEKEYLLENSDKQVLFDIWSLKEAFIKFSGAGLSYGMESFLVIPFMEGINISNMDVKIYDEAQNTFINRNLNLYGNVFRDNKGYSTGVISEEEGIEITFYEVKADGSLC